MIANLSDMLQDTSAIAVDVGQHMVWSYQSFKNREGQKLLFSGGHGAMGYGLPAAIGAYYATGRPVVCICGDGAFQMKFQESENPSDGKQEVERPVLISLKMHNN